MGLSFEIELSLNGMISQEALGERERERGTVIWRESMSDESAAESRLRRELAEVKASLAATEASLADAEAALAAQQVEVSSPVMQLSYLSNVHPPVALSLLPQSDPTLSASTTGRGSE